MQDFVLQTKLHPPQLKGKILRRARLLNLLKENLDKKLILICADAGYGKTTLLAQLCEELDKPYVFYDLDSSDNDIATFFNYLVAGIQRHYPDFGKRTRGVLPQTRNIEIIVGTFINEFWEHFPRRTSQNGDSSAAPQNDKREDFYIILDDYHHLQQNKEIGKALDYLLRHIPSNLHLIISSRSTPPLNLAYYLAKQELFEIKKEHLQFNIKEIQELLREGYGLNVPDSEIERIETHSEGWITAIQLILQKISVIGEDKAKETLNGYIASGEEIFNYFAREVFESQPKEIQEFLMKTSILEYLNPPICDYLLNIKEAKRILSFLYSEHIFISRFQENYRYHPLFREFLFVQLRNKHSKNKIKLLFCKIGGYFVKMRDYFSAANYYLFSEHYEKSAKILEKACRVLPLSEKLYTLLSLLDRLPTEIFYSHPYLCLVKGKILSSLGKWNEGLNILHKAKKVADQQKENRIVAEILYQIGYIYLFLMQPKKALFYENQALKMLDKSSSILKAQIFIAIGNINRTLGRYGKAEDFLKQSLHIAQKTNNKDIEIKSLEGLARVYSTKTDFNEAVEIYTKLLSKYEDRKSQLSYADLCANAAALNIEVGNFTEGERMLNSAEVSATVFNNRRAIVYISGIRGKLYLAQGDYQKAIEQYKKTIELNRDLNDKLVDLYARIDIIIAYISAGEITRAKCELNKIANLITPKMPPPIIIDFLVIKGKISRAENDLKATEENLGRALKYAEEFQLFYQKMSILYQLSECYLNYNNEEKVVDCLKRCLAVAEEKGYDFFLIREAKNDLILFEYALNKNINNTYLIDILEKVNSVESRHLIQKIAAEQKLDFKIQLFGGPIIRDKNNHILDPNWRTRKVESLFIYLLLNQGKQILKDHLIEIFWPDKGLNEARQSLNEQVSFVRKGLQLITGGKHRAKDLIGYKNQSYHLSDKLYFKVDVFEFEQLIKEGERIERTNQSQAIELYKRALALYSGDFCPGQYANWAEEVRRCYRYQALNVVKKLAQFCYSNKDYQQSLILFRRALQFDRCDETIHLGIMHSLSALGDKNGVIQQYKELKEILEQDMGISPSTEAVRIYQRLLCKNR